MKRFLFILTATALSVATAATNLVSNTAIVTNRVQGIVTYTMSNGVARVQDPSGKLVGTAEERALKVAAEGQADIASAAADAAGTAMEEWREFTATTDVKVVYIDAGFTQDLPALAPNLCGWVAGSFYDREKGEDHYYIWFNREIDYPPSMCARIVSESSTNWLDAAWVDWGVTNWIDKATGREVEWRGARKYSAEVEYLESTGTQYINSGVARKLNDVFTVDFQFPHPSTGGHETVYGQEAPLSYRLIFRRFKNFGFYGYTGSDFYTIASSDTARHVCVARQGVGYEFDGIFTENTYQNKDATASTILFASRQDSGEISDFGNVRIFSYSQEQNGTVILDLIPVLDLAGRPAMYDRVSGQLFYNSGTGEFSYGPVTAAPVPCRELVVPRRNANCVLKTGTVITLGGKDGFDADIHKVNIEVGGTPTATTSAQLPLFYAVTRSGTNTVTRAYTNGFVNVENGFIKDPSNE